MSPHLNKSFQVTSSTLEGGAMSKHAPRNKGVLAFWVVILVVTVLFAAFGLRQYLQPQAIDPQVSSPSASPTPSSEDPDPSLAATPSPLQQKQACEGQQPFEPKLAVVPALKLRLPIANLPFTEDGLYPVPLFDGPLDPRMSAARTPQNALACADGQGVVRLGAHTYREGGASGNLLGHNAQEGMTVRLYGENKADVACYEITPFEGEITPTWLNGTVPVDRLTPVSGPGGVVFEFCWDKPSEWGEWNRHRYVRAVPVTCG